MNIVVDMDTNIYNFESNLISCNKCYNVYQYYDYLSHSEVCISSGNIINNYVNNYENNNANMDIEDEADEYEDGEDDEADDDNDTYINYDYINDSNNTNMTYDLYNPFINRNFINNNNNENDNINNLSNYMENININNSNQNQNYNQSHSTIGIKDLSLYSIIKHIPEDLSCTICLNNYNKGSEFYIMNCNHSFCVTCTERWFKSNTCCPLCRKSYI